jgi:SAM-dependent methyltransferase
MNLGNRNSASDVVHDFGLEWQAFDQAGVPAEELRRMFDAYFKVFPWERISQQSVGFDCGCGSGRWARLMAPRVGELHCIDPSTKALDVARRNLAELGNCRFHCASVDAMPLADGSMDFGYSLGVLHHVPDTQAGISACVAKLKAGAPFALYLYYAFDDRPAWFVAVWKTSDVVRRLISRAPFWLKYPVTQVIAALVYWPLARLARLCEAAGLRAANLPLYSYRDKSFYSMRTDALDRFGTRLEQRFTRSQIREMMAAAGLTDIRFSDAAPYWCAVGLKK